MSLEADLLKKRFKRERGKPLLFDHPEELLELAIAYFRWNEENPNIEVETKVVQGQEYTLKTPKMRAMSIERMCLHMGIERKTFYNYEKKPEFTEVCNAIRDAIRSQKFEGASAGLLSHAVIIRDLGLIDKQELDSTVKLSDLSDDELNYRIKALEDELAR